MRSIALCYTIAVLVAAPDLANARKKHAPEGYLLFPVVATPDVLARYKGFEAPTIFLYAADGRAIVGSGADGSFKPGMIVPLAPGFYDVRWGAKSAKLPRYRYLVKARQLTVVQSGLLVVVARPTRDQPQHDRCAPWSGRLRVFQRGVLVGRSAPSSSAATGIVQLHPGRYDVEWHGLRTPLEVKDNAILDVPRGYIQPLRDADHHRLAQTKSPGPQTPVLQLCAKGPTQVLAGRFYEMFTPRSTDSAQRLPRVRVRTLVPAEGGLYQPLSPLRVRGYRLFRGKGSKPQLIAP
ncbi:MAG: hypothetical protein KC609_17160 [Myxococcales bacterium]|nr:hypothetical protein [Myxococcales bacterium]